MKLVLFVDGFVGNEKYQALKILNLLRARTFKGHPGCFFEENDIKYENSLTIKKIN